MAKPKRDLVVVSHSGRSGKIYHNEYLYRTEWATMVRKGCTSYAETMTREEAEAQGNRPCKKCSP
jgi:hypothetical protein